MNAEARPGGNDPWNARDGFRLGGRRIAQIEFLVDGKRVLAEARTAPNVVIRRLVSGAIAAMEAGSTYVVTPYDPFEAADAAGTATDRVVTPMPGRIVQLLVREGETVAKGQPLAVLEAMKMEHTLSAPAAATVEAVAVAVGDQVGDGTIVVRFAAEKAA